MKASVCAILISLISLSTWAASEGAVDGGGGNAVVCFRDPEIPKQIRDKTSPTYGEILESYFDKIKSIETYDLYIARMASGIDSTPTVLIEPTSNASLRAYPEKIAKRFEAYIPSLARMIRAGAANFPNSQITVRDSGLVRVHDENDQDAYLDRVNCVVATMAVQRLIGGQFFMQIDGRLFNHPQHSSLSKAVLFLHEAIYSTVRWRKESPHYSSRNTRLLIRRLIAANDVRMGEISALLESLDFTLGREDIVSLWALSTKAKFYEALKKNLKKPALCASGASGFHRDAKPVLRSTLRSTIVPEIERLPHLSKEDRQTLEKSFARLIDEGMTFSKHCSEPLPQELWWKVKCPYADKTMCLRGQMPPGPNPFTRVPAWSEKDLRANMEIVLSAISELESVVP